VEIRTWHSAEQGTPECSVYGGRATGGEEARRSFRSITELGFKKSGQTCFTPAGRNGRKDRRACCEERNKKHVVPEANWVKLKESLLFYKALILENR